MAIPMAVWWNRRRQSMSQVRFIRAIQKLVLELVRRIEKNGDVHVNAA